MVVVIQEAAGVQLSSCLPDEDKPPAQQSLPRQEKRQKEAVVLNNALDQLNGHWDDKKYDGQ